MWTANNRKYLWVIGGIAALLIAIIATSGSSKSHEEDIVILSEVQPRSFQVEVHTVGELEAARSTIVASSIRGDLGKIIYLIPDGVTVRPGEILVKMDPTPFEEKIAELRSKIKDQKATIRGHVQTLNWERNQAALEDKTASFELEAAQLELDKTVKGDGPLELFKLQSAMQKAMSKFEELNAYSQDLVNMENEGYINHSERKQAEKKLKEEKEAFENAKLQFETFSKHVHPMVVKKAETTLKRCQLRLDEVAKSGRYKVEKAYAALNQAKQAKKDFSSQLKAAQQELEQSEIRAPFTGMVVHREEYRSGQKRKPRVGDILVKNQPILDLPDLNSMVVKTKVREVDLYKVQIGKPVLIEVDAYPQVFFKGIVQSIGVLALSDIGRSGIEKYFEVKVDMVDTDARLRPGMTARVTILADKVENALTVPVPAIFEKNKRPCCYLADKNGFHPTAIKTGANNEQWVEIVEGLNAGDKVALTTPPAERIISEEK
jgi:HlyD family secretion protein